MQGRAYSKYIDLNLNKKFNLTSNSRYGMLQDGAFELNILKTYTVFFFLSLNNMRNKIKSFMFNQVHVYPMSKSPLVTPTRMLFCSIKTA